MLTNWTFAQFDGGSGLPNDPYLVNTAEQLNEVRNHLNAHFLQTSPINLDVAPFNEGEGWLPIAVFNGRYDGGGHTISGLFINRLGSNIGLFGETGSNAEIRNVHLSNMDVSGRFSVGGLVGRNQGTVVACSAGGSITGLREEYEFFPGEVYFDCAQSFAGLAGENSGGAIDSCSTTVNVEGLDGGCCSSPQWMAGFVGRNTNGGTISNSQSNGALTGSSFYCGGFIGNMDGGEVRNCISTTDIQDLIRSTEVGGFVGSVRFDALLEECESRGLVEADENYIGGFCGHTDMSGVNILRCKATGDVVGAGAVGGFVGWHNSTLISDCYARGNVIETAGYNAGSGGFAGHNRSTITRCYSTGTVTSEDNAAYGFADVNGGTISDSYWDTEASGLLISDGTAEGRTTSEMTFPHDVNTFVNWDFLCTEDDGSENIWAEGMANGGYPTLAWEGLNSCGIDGCTDQDACNYDLEATQDDGSCIYPDSELLDCDGNCVNDADGDGVCDENEILGCTDSNACNYDATATDPGGTTTLTFNSAAVTNLAGNHPAGIADDDAVEFTVTFDDSAISYDSGYGGGSCDDPWVSECDLLSWEISPAGSYTITYESGYSESGSITRIVMEDGGIEDFGDGFPWDRSDRIEFFDGGNDIYEANTNNGGTYPTLYTDFFNNLDNLQNAEFDKSFYWANWGNWGTYHYDYTTPQDIVLISYESYACIYPSGFLDCDGNCINDSDGDGVCDEDEVLGCTDQTACNYNNEATQDDSTCEFESCAGCTDQFACNYDNAATLDNGSCQYPDQGYDCNDVCLSDTDGDGVCDLNEVPGCTDQTACNYDASVTDSGGNITVTMISEVTFTTGGQLPAGVNVGDQVTLSFTVDVNDLTLNPGFSANYDCDEFNPNIEGCDMKAWQTAQPTEYTITYTGGYSETGTFDHLVFVDGGFENFLGSINNREDYFYLYLGNDDMYKATRFNGEFMQGGVPTNIYANILSLLQSDFDMTQYFANWGCCWLTYHYDYTTPGDVTQVSITNEAVCTYPEDPLFDCDGNCVNDADGDGVCDENEILGCTDETACNYDPAATEPGGLTSITFNSAEVTNLAGNHPAGIADGDSVIFTVTFSDENIVSDQNHLNNLNFCNSPDLIDCNAISWAMGEPSDYTITYESGYSESGTFTHIVIVDGGFEDYGFGDPSPRQDQIFFYDNLNDIFEAARFDGNYKTNLSMELLTELADIESADFDLSFYWANWGNWGTYHYDYTTPQDVVQVSLESLACIYPAIYYNCDDECLSDTDGDGVCDELEIDGCTDQTACNYVAEATDDDGSCDFVSCLGCTDEAACNYDVNATQDDGSCTYPEVGYDCSGTCLGDLDMDGICDQNEVPGCNDPNACNYDITATDDGGLITVSFTSTVTSVNGGNAPAGINEDDQVTLTFTIDASDLTLDAAFDQINACDDDFLFDAILVGCDIKAWMPSAPVDYTITYTGGYSETQSFDRLVFVDGGTEIHNEFGESPKSDSFRLYSGNTHLFEVTNFYGSAIVGIVDNPYYHLQALANADFELTYYWANQNSGWTTYHYDYTTPEDFTQISVVNDGLCQFSNDPLLDCEGNCLNDANNNGVCDENEVPGCTDQAACNYDENANLDDDSCVYATDFIDCDGNCLSDADGDGVCDENEIAGCTYQLAANFDPQATDDDGSCQLSESICGQGTYFDADAGQCLPEANECPEDLNSDGLVNSSDLLQFLGTFGQACE